VGTVGNRVAFVVIGVSPANGKPEPNPVRVSSSYPIRSDGKAVRESLTASLVLPKDKSIPLPLRAQLIEVKDGKVRISNRRVTHADVKAYLDSKIENCSLDDLLKFIDARHKAAGK
jgi:hypothetical protein